MLNEGECEVGRIWLRDVGLFVPKCNESRLSVCRMRASVSAFMVIHVWYASLIKHVSPFSKVDGCVSCVSGINLC